jgi:4-amino-4-deoxy-L-arabinose transferase-like glycosyltransferase
LFVGVSLLYVAISRGAFLYGDDILMFQVTESIVERGSVAVSSPHTEGDVAVAIRGRDGRGYAKYGVGLSLVAIPTYVVSDVLLDHLLPLGVQDDNFGNRRLGPVLYGTALTNAIVGGAAALLAYLLALACGYRQQTALALALLLAIGTLLAHYSASFLSEPLSALCLTATVYGLTRAAGSGLVLSQRWLAFSGFAAGVALATKLANGVALVAPGLWLLWLAWRRSRVSSRAGVVGALTWGAPVAVWLAGIAWYNWLRFGSVTSTGYRGEATAYTTPFYEGLYGLVLSPGRGLVWYDPPLFLAVAGSAWFARRRPALALTILGMLAGTLLLYSRYYAWYGGGVWGTRFLVPLLPLLILPAAEIVERAWEGRRWAVVAVAVAAAGGLCVTLLGVLVPFERYVQEYSASQARLDAALWETMDSPIVVHAGRVDDSLTSIDVAAERYGSWRLVQVSVASLLGGAAALWYAVWTTLSARAETRAGRSARLP